MADPPTPDIARRNRHQATVAYGLLDLWSCALQMQADRLDDDWGPGVESRHVRERIIEAHFFLIAARNIWRALELASGAGSKAAKRQVRQLRADSVVQRMRSLLEHIDRHAHDYEPDDTIMSVDSPLGRTKPTIVTPDGSVDVAALERRLRDAVDEVRDDLKTILAAASGRYGDDVVANSDPSA